MKVALGLPSEIITVEGPHGAPHRRPTTSITAQGSSGRTSAVADAASAVVGTLDATTRTPGAPSRPNSVGTGSAGGRAVG